MMIAFPVKNCLHFAQNFERKKETLRLKTRFNWFFFCHNIQISFFNKKNKKNSSYQTNPVVIFMKYSFLMVLLTLQIKMYIKNQFNTAGLLWLTQSWKAAKNNKWKKKSLPKRVFFFTFYILSLLQY